MRSLEGERALDAIHVYLNRTLICSTMLLALTALLAPRITRAQSSDQANVNLSGRWQGTRSSTGDSGQNGYKVHSIQFDMKQSGESISGSYKCFAGKEANTDCNNPVGTITSGTIEDGMLKLQVQALPNNLACSFKGSVQGSRMSGNFVCYVAGTIASNGVWEVHRHEGE
jgi:hypothetical protein